MSINGLIYFLETIISIIAILIGIIRYENKDRKEYIIFLSLIISTYIIIFGTTFMVERPEIHIRNVETVEAKTNQVLQKPETKYHFKDVTDKVRIVGNINYNVLGEYEIYYEVNTILGPYLKKSTVKVVDTTSPMITLVEGQDYEQSYSKEYEEPGYSVIDSYDGDISEKVKATKEDIDETHFNIKYEVEDSSGNKAEIKRAVTIVDDIPPVITLNGSESMLIYLNDTYTEKGAKAEDEKDGDLTEKIVIQGSVDTSKEGSYTITYTVSDNSGNEANKTRKINVQKKILIQAQNGTGGNKGVIYLTFDDGPSSNITSKVLDILKQANVKATFFILNYSAANESLVKREHNEGHTVAIHGYSHDYSTIYQSETAYMENITKLQQKILASTGYNATITRFPGGSSNTVSKFNPGIMTRLCKLVVDSGYRYFDWNVSSGDAGGAQNADQLYNNVVKGLSKSKQNVVLMHDFASNAKLLSALPRIINYGIENGYTFSRITESTPMVTHSPNN